MSFILGSNSVPSDYEAKEGEARKSRKGEIFEEESNFSTGNWKSVRDEIEKETLKNIKQNDAKGVEKSKKNEIKKNENIEKQRKSNMIFEEESDDVSL